MPEPQDLMDGVASDLTAVRWLPAAELRRRVRRRRQRVTAAAVALVTALTAAGATGAAGVGFADRDSAPPPATTPSVAAEGPLVIPASALLRPDDAGAGPDTQQDSVDAFQPIGFGTMLNVCFQERAPELLALRPRYAYGQTLLLGTENDRPARPYLLAQAAYRLSAPLAATFLDDVRAATEGCDGFTQTGEIERDGAKVEARGEYHWSVVATGFAGDESILVRQDARTRNVKTGKVLGESSELRAYVRVGDLVTVLSPRSGTAVDEVRRLGTVAAERLCGAAHPPC